MIATAIPTQLGERAQLLYEQIKSKIEYPENIGKMVVMDVESGDYEIDKMGLESSERLQLRHPGSTLFAMRIGYKYAASFDGVLERNEP